MQGEGNYTPKFDFKCLCGTIRPDVYVTNWTTATGRQMPISCPDCGREMEKQPAAPNFSVKGYSAKTGYHTKGDA